jgi:hypothetical protein
MRDAETRLDAFEVQLGRALAWQPSERSLARLDARVADALARRRVRRWSRPLLLVAAAIALMGAAISLTLVQQAASLIPGHKVAYDRGSVLNFSRSVDGYKVVLERAYLDPNQLVLAFSVPQVGSVGPIVPRADVVDSEGRHYLDFAGGDVTDETFGSGTIMAFDAPPGVTGTVHLSVMVPFLMTLRTVPPDVVPEQPLTYQFDLAVQPSRTVTVDQPVEVGDRSVTLRWLRFSATAVRLRLDVDLTGLVTDDHPTWTFDATLRRPDGSSEALSWEALPPDWTGQSKEALGAMLDAMDGSVRIYQTRSGTDDASGTWTVTVNRLIGFDRNGGTTEVRGPWVFTVKVP